MAAYLNTGFYMSWEFLMLILGIPVMSYKFIKE